MNLVPIDYIELGHKFSLHPLHLWSIHFYIHTIELLTGLQYKTNDAIQDQIEQIQSFLETGRSLARQTNNPKNDPIQEPVSHSAACSHDPAGFFMVDFDPIVRANIVRCAKCNHTWRSNQVYPRSATFPQP